ncbi:unnamed protein product [Prorocentrum cordatum]|uniref:Uncharacterized protein n=1 Tax=Prorocentrum cordatum TaxID=2364126 RepID=A0ABN9UQM1_9DINO|nr:unnamed protein product [Polarella glacialis]
MRAARLSRFENQGGSSAAEGGREPASQPPVAGLSSAGSGRAASSAGPPAGPAPEVMGHVQTATFGAAPEGEESRAVDTGPSAAAPGPARTTSRSSAGAQSEEDRRPGESAARERAPAARGSRERGPKKIRQRVSQSSWASASPTPGRRWRSAAGTGSSPPTGCWCGARMPPRPSGWPPPRLACGLPSTRPQRRHAQLASTGRSARPRSLSARPGWHITAPLGSATLSALP